MKKIADHELTFISNLFTDKDVSVTFKETRDGYYIISFIPDNYEDDYIIEYLYTGNLRAFLAIISEAYIPDSSALCNLADAAKSALMFLK